MRKEISLFFLNSFLVFSLKKTKTTKIINIDTKQQIFFRFRVRYSNETSVRSEFLSRQVGTKKSQFSTTFNFNHATFTPILSTSIAFRDRSNEQILIQIFMCALTRRSFLFYLVFPLIVIIPILNRLNDVIVSLFYRDKRSTENSI